MEKDTYTLRQKIENEITELTRDKEAAMDSEQVTWCDGCIYTLRRVLGWIDEQERGT